MTMICRIEDEHLTNPWDGEDRDVAPVAGLNGFSLYDLMAEDCTVWVGKNKQFGFTMEIEDENGNDVVVEKGIHPYAMESLASFCRRFLGMYEKLES